jgi:hypothetical protein
MISSSMRVGFMSLDSFGVGVGSDWVILFSGEEHELSPANNPKVRPIKCILRDLMELSMTKDGPRCPFGQY